MGFTDRDGYDSIYFTLAWPLIKYASRSVYIMPLITCMIVERKCNKKFVHSLTLLSGLYYKGDPAFLFLDSFSFCV
jgi:hypothetical protein